MKIRLTLNGEERELELEPYRSLLDALRNEAGLTGTKKGCDVGDCGACTVIVDGKPVCSCLVLAVEADGAAVQTIEGLGRNGNLHPLQESFVILDRELVDYLSRLEEFPVLRNLKTLDPIEETWIDAKGVLRTDRSRREMRRETPRIEVVDDAGVARRLWQDDTLPDGAEPLTEDDR